MTKKALIDVQADGLVPGLTVVGFHGAMAADETPAKLGPVYANAAGRLTRIVEVGPTRATPIHRMRIESFEPPLADGGPLPGNGTRIGPWSARLGNVVMAIGPYEQRKVAELRRYASTHGTPPVERFIEWFANHELRSEDLQCERQNEIALWCCTAGDGFALLKCVHHVVKDAFFAAVRSQSSADMEETAWWLSRAAVDDHDIYLAGAALRRMDSPAWELLVREGLHLPKKAQWKDGLEAAERTLDHPPPVATSLPAHKPAIATIGSTLMNKRSELRNLFMTPEAA
ncbi:MAG: hypothetical protein ACMG6S_04305 [Byssovorax sp.]